MKKLALTVSIFVAGALSATAADLAPRPYTKAPAPVIAAAYDWSGFYIGANGGYGTSRKCWDNTILAGVPTVPAFPEGCHDATGGTAGGQIGYRWQSASWVFGLEAQGNWADLKGSRISNGFAFVPGDLTNRSKIDAIGLFTGQVGFAFNNMLLYVKGGAAVTRDKYDDLVVSPRILNPLVDRASETRWGAVVGVGGEYSFTPNWSFGLEYDHLFMGTRDVVFTFTTPPFASSKTDRIRQDVDLFTARINYRFGGPVVARY